MSFRQLATEEAPLSYFFGCSDKDKTAFVEYLIKDIPPRPAHMDEMVRVNLGLAA